MGKESRSNTETHSAYLATSEWTWRVINQGMPACRNGDETSARSVAALFGLDLSHCRVWDGDTGMWIADLRGDM